MGGPQRHTPMGRNHTWAPGHPPPLDHRAHHHLGTTDGLPPHPPHRPRQCHNHTNGGRPRNSSPRPRRPHPPASIVGTYGYTSRPHPMASHRHHLCPNDHTQTWQHRWEDTRGDLLQEHLGLTRTHHTLHPIRGVGQAPHGIHTPGIWVYATPINPKEAGDIKTALSIQQAQTLTPHRNTQRGDTIWWAYQDHDTPSPLPGALPLDTNTTALLQDAAAAATQVGAPETWGPQ